MASVTFSVTLFSLTKESSGSFCFCLLIFPPMIFLGTALGSLLVSWVFLEAAAFLVSITFLLLSSFFNLLAGVDMFFAIPLDAWALVDGEDLARSVTGSVFLGFDLVSLAIFFLADFSILDPAAMFAFSFSSFSFWT